jgi:nucleotidyltransferase substrate binding protein (TIGR01987 family)
MNIEKRWTQRFQNYKKALVHLSNAINLSKERNLSLLEKQGLIKAFEFTHELAWNLLKDYLEYQGYQNIKGSRDTFRAAIKIDLISNGELWLDTILARNNTAHGYDEEAAEGIHKLIEEKYIKIFLELENQFESIISNEI